MTDHAFLPSLDPLRQNENRPTTTAHLLIEKRSIFLAIQTFSPNYVLLPPSFFAFQE